MEIIVAERIRDLMKEYGLNQVKLANQIGLKQNTISAWLRNKKEPSITSLWLLADYFDVDIDSQGFIQILNMAGNSQNGGIKE